MDEFIKESIEESIKHTKILYFQFKTCKIDLYYKHPSFLQIEQIQLKKSPEECNELNRSWRFEIMNLFEIKNNHHVPTFLLLLYIQI
jgi:hypothetical protein